MRTLLFRLAFLMALPLAGCSGDDARLGSHTGDAAYRTYRKDALVTESAGPSEILLTDAGGDRRRITLPGIGCEIEAIRAEDGQLVSPRVVPGCDLRRLAPERDATSDPMTVATLDDGNVSFYEDGDGDPVVILSGTLMKAGVPTAVWTWTFFAHHDG